MPKKIWSLLCLRSHASGICKCWSKGYSCSSSHTRVWWLSTIGGRTCNICLDLQSLGVERGLSIGCVHIGCKSATQPTCTLVAKVRNISSFYSPFCFCKDVVSIHLQLVVSAFTISYKPHCHICEHWCIRILCSFVRRFGHLGFLVEV